MNTDNRLTNHANRTTTLLRIVIPKGICNQRYALCVSYTIWLVVILFFLTLYMHGCSNTKYEQLAKDGVEQFHHELDVGHVQSIYALTHESYRATLTEQESITFFEDLHNKLGKFRQDELLTISTNYSVNGVQLIMIYKTIYDVGEAEERFVWQIRGNKAQLVRYDINPPAPITK